MQRVLGLVLLALLGFIDNCIQDLAHFSDDLPARFFDMQYLEVDFVQYAGWRGRN